MFVDLLRGMVGFVGTETRQPISMVGALANGLGLGLELAEEGMGIDQETEYCVGSSEF